MSSIPMILLSKEDALSIFEHIEGVIHKYWDEVCEEAQLSEVDRKYLWKRQFLNPFSFEE
jgi:serine/threonine-protein kinase HipA